MINLTNLLLFFILVTLATYTFMPWKGIDKGSKRKIAAQFMLWVFVFGGVFFCLKSVGFLV
jgi:hypothetical protein